MLYASAGSRLVTKGGFQLGQSDPAFLNSGIQGCPALIGTSQVLPGQAPSRDLRAHLIETPGLVVLPIVKAEGLFVHIPEQIQPGSTRVLDPQR